MQKVTTSNNTMEVFRGKLENLSSERPVDSFLLPKASQLAFGDVGLVSDAFDEIGQASTISMPTSESYEFGDWVTFELNGKRFSGLLWRCPFREGDQVEVVAKQDGDDYQVFAIARPKDRIVVLHPHCSRGRAAHWKAVFFLYLKCGLYSWFAFYLIFSLFDYFEGGPEKLQYIYSDIGVVSVLAGIIFSVLFVIGFPLACKGMNTVRLAEQIFAAFAWDNPKNIDLIARTKASPLDCKASNIPEFESEMPEWVVSSVSYGVGFYRY